MSGKTNIEWATRSWNPTVGCDRVSDGCTNCYAYYLHDRMRFAPNVRAARAAGYRTPTAARAEGARLPLSRQYDVPFSSVQLLPGRLKDPGRWREPELVFVDSMADLMHDAVPDGFLDDVFAEMEAIRRHIYFVLTKRPARLRDYVRRRYGGAPVPAHIWLGTSVEDERVLERVDILREAPARVRFLSCEPLIGPIDKIELDGIHWVITGGESGRRRRRFDPAWARTVRRRCRQNDVAFFHKQNGGLTPKSGGRELDGRTWSEYPRIGLRPSPASRRARAQAAVA